MTKRDRIIDAFLTRWSATPELLFASNAPRFWGYTRQVAMYLFHDVCDDTFEEIAELFAGETPETVILKVKDLEMSRATDPKVETMLQAYYDLIDKPYHGRHKTTKLNRSEEQLSLAEDGESIHRL